MIAIRREPLIDLKETLRFLLFLLGVSHGLEVGGNYTPLEDCVRTRQASIYTLSLTTVLSCRAKTTREAAL